jgi:adenine-specific DNA-methyltransferase
MVESILGKGAFAFPKDVDIVADLVGMVTEPGDFVLDSFGGSGTTAQSILQINHRSIEVKDRHFVLVQQAYENPRQELERENICRDITALRVRRVAEGYTAPKGEQVNGLGGGFRYVRLGEALFDEHGRIREDRVRFADLARHVFFSETGEPIPKDRISAKSPLLGIHHGRAVYLLYNGILQDKSVDGGNVLTAATLEHLPRFDGPKVAYAAGCRFSKSRLEREGITFKQTPYSIRTR